MGLFDSFYDTNGDGRLSGFERVRYDEANMAYPGSQVPDLINDRYEAHLVSESRKGNDRSSSFYDWDDEDPDDDDDDWDDDDDFDDEDDEDAWDEDLDDEDDFDDDDFDDED